ncbi:nucleolin [Microplitis demolitor]|uniref:nucleolin n=1 Tax=Microplitis demolitor TaxID=69319 RepID=UPI0006D52732|nr:nucleolin [Microplitis demolitor]
MKHQQVTVDFLSMVFSAATYLALAGAAWIFLRLLQACFWLPRHLKRQNNLQDMLQEKVNSYEKYILECEEKEKAAAAAGERGEGVIEDKDSNEDGEAKPLVIDEKKWKERRECLDMLKKELKRVSDGGDPYDWEHLLEEEDEEDANEDKKDEKKSDGDEEDLNSEKLDDVPEKGLEEKKEQ